MVVHIEELMLISILKKCGILDILMKQTFKIVRKKYSIFDHENNL